LAQDWLLFLLTTLLYHLLIHKSNQNKKQKHQYFGAKICYLPFCLYFLSFFSRQKKIPPKARVRTTQRKNATAE